MNHDRTSPDDHELARLALGAKPVVSGPCLSLLEVASYVDGRCSEADQERIECHLVACATCLQTLLETGELLAEPAMVPPSPVVVRAQALVPAKARTASPASWRNIAGWAATAAAVVAVGAIGLTLGTGLRHARHRTEAALAAELSFQVAAPDDSLLGDRRLSLWLGQEGG